MELTRWHARTCKIPDVFFELETARCKSCGASCNWKDLLALAQAGNTSGSALSSIPPNEPIGRLNLWWPACVPYTSSSQQEFHVDEESLFVEGLQLTGKGMEKGKEAAESSPELESSSQLSPRPGDDELNVQGSQVNSTLDTEPLFYPVEREVLSADQFRLVCLSVASDRESPVHVSLEVYPHDDCPEYETVSYTWGGENGDSNLSRPIYVGPYWDILLQTENCWEMLRFTRPWRGIRMIWNDALSINQSNPKERGEQVGNMGNIYRNCTRTVVYLGPDIIQLPTGQFPHRESLHSLENSAIIPQLPKSHPLQSSSNLLEYLLHRRYFSRVWVIQELILCRQAIIRVGDIDFLADASVWNDLSPEWQWDSVGAPWVQHLGERQVPANDVYELLALTSKSQAADPRDRLFGVLDLLKAGARDAALFPDYSLSAAHVFIGFFAHCLINLGMVNQFLHAVGLSHPSLPSWVPDWTNQESWELIFSSRKNDFVHIAALLSSELAGTSDGRWASLHNSSWYLGHYFLYEQPYANNSRKHSSGSNATVDREAGILTINLTRFCVLPCCPKRIMNDDHYGYYEFCGQEASLCFVTEKYGLEEMIIQPGKDELFILDDGRGTYLYLILRKLNNSKECQKYKLVVSCHHIFIALGNSADTLLSMNNLITSVFAAAMDVRRMRKRPVRYGRNILVQYFPGQVTLGTLFQLRCELKRLGDNNVLACNCACLVQMRASHPNSNVRIQDKWFRFTILKEESHLLHNYNYIYFAGSSYPRAEWLKNGKWTPVPVEAPCGSGLDEPHEVEIRLPLDGLAMAITNSPLFGDLELQYENIAKVMKITFEAAVTLVDSELGEELRYIGCPLGFETMEDFQVDGSYLQIQIF